MELLDGLRIAVSLLGLSALISAMLKIYRQTQMCHEINISSFMVRVMLAMALMLSSSLLFDLSMEVSVTSGNTTHQTAQNKHEMKDNLIVLEPETTEHF